MYIENGSLKRTLTLYQLILFGLAYLTPIIVYGIYGIIAQATHGMVVTAYGITLIAMLFTAYSYGQMVKAYPYAGSAYTFTKKSINPHLGFMVGWSVLLDYVFIPMAIWLIGGSYLTAAFPGVPIYVWILLFIIITTMINIVGINLTVSINVLMMIFQILVVVIFIILCIVQALQTGSGSLIRSAPFINGSAPFSTVFAGSAIACYSFLGFDALSTMTEETKNPEKTIPKAIFLVTLFGGIFFIVASYFAQLAFPDFNAFKDVSSAGFEIAEKIGGTLFSSIFLAGLVIGQFTSGLTAQASASRLLFAMGRDSALPKKVFGSLHSKYRTPVFNLLIIALIALISLKMDVTSSTSFINFGAFITFTLVNVSVIFHYFIKSRKRTLKDVLLYVLLPLFGAGFDFYLLLNLDKNALILGIIWAAIGFIYLLFLTKGFTRQPPELDMEEFEKQSDPRSGKTMST